MNNERTNNARIKQRQNNAWKRTRQRTERKKEERGDDEIVVAASDGRMMAKWLEKSGKRKNDAGEEKERKTDEKEEISTKKRGSVVNKSETESNINGGAAMTVSRTTNPTTVGEINRRDAVRNSGMTRPIEICSIGESSENIIWPHPLLRLPLCTDELAVPVAADAGGAATGDGLASDNGFGTSVSLSSLNRGIAPGCVGSGAGVVGKPAVERRHGGGGGDDRDGNAGSTGGRESLVAKRIIEIGDGGVAVRIPFRVCLFIIVSIRGVGILSIGGGEDDDRSLRLLGRLMQHRSGLAVSSCNGIFFIGESWRGRGDNEDRFIIWRLSCTIRSRRLRTGRGRRRQGAGAKPVGRRILDLLRRRVARKREGDEPTRTGIKTEGVFWQRRLFVLVIGTTFAHVSSWIESGGRGSQVSLGRGEYSQDRARGAGDGGGQHRPGSKSRWESRFGGIVIIAVVLAVAITVGDS